MNSIAAIIKEARKANNLTQKALGIACGYEDPKTAERTVQLWEHGDRPVPLEKIRILAKTLHLTLDQLIP